MGKLGLNSGYIGSDQRTTTNGVVGYDKYYLERVNGRFLPVLEGDSDALAFFNRVAIAGGTVSPTERLAVIQLVSDLKLSNIWTSMKAIYPMVGASAVACAQNLRSSSFTGTFSGGWIFSNTGVQGNGSNGQFLSNFRLNDFSSRFSVAFGLYSRTNITSNGTGMTAKNNVEFYAKYNDSGLAYSYLFDLNNDNVSRASYLGLNSHSRTSSSQKYMQTKTTVNSFASNVDVTSLDNSIVTFSKTNQGFDPNEYALYYISDGLTDTQLLSLNTIVNNFQTYLSRAV